MTHRLDKLPYRSCARLDVSGARVRVCCLFEGDEDSIVLHTDEQIEPIFFTPNEARMIIAALNVCIDACEKP